MKPIFVMMCGLPASGKSTYANKLTEEIDASVFSSDALREEMFGDVNNQSNNQKLFQELHRRIKECLASGKSAIYDATNLSSKRRKAFLNELTKIPCEKKCVIMATPFEKCVENNRNRERQVPEYIMWRMYKSWQTPAMFEGWDRIDISYWENSKRSINAMDYICSLTDFDQDNPHHTLTLGQHMAKTYMLASGNPDNDYDVTYAASLHDIGKVKCKTYFNYKGDKCEHAHYYGHENVGAYNVLFFDFYVNQTDELTLAVSLLISLHMKFYHFDRDKNPQKHHDKYKKLWGDVLYNKVLELHNADKLAH